jgi:RNA polymerase sigma-70 factor (ECF subfamily)
MLSPFWKNYIMHISEGIIEQLASGSQEAFHTVYKVAYPQVRAFSKGLVKNDADADDITQLVFIKLWTKRSMLKEVKNFNTYLYTITKNTVLNHLATRKAFTVDIAGMGDRVTGSATPQEQVEARDLQLLIDMVVENMPPQRQTIYKLSREEGLSNDQIAERLGLQKKTVENHLNLALGDIRNMLKILILLLYGWGKSGPWWSI